MADSYFPVYQIVAMRVKCFLSENAHASLRHYMEMELSLTCPRNRIKVAV